MISWTKLTTNLSWKKKDSASFQAFGKIKIKGDRRSEMV